MTEVSTAPDYGVVSQSLNAESGDEELEFATANEGDADIFFPPVYYDGSSEYFMSDVDWMTHSSWAWMYSLSGNYYYHLPTEGFYYFDPDSNQFFPYSAPSEIAAPTTAKQFDTLSPLTSADAEYEELPAIGEYEVLEDKAYQTTTDERNDYFFMDFDKDMGFCTAQLMSTIKGKTEREDRHVTKERLELDAFSDSQACCFYTAIFDGHGGAVCAEYCTKHLKNNLMAAYQTAKQTINKKLQKHEAASGVPATSYDLGLTYSSDIEALRRGLQKAFEITDTSYLSIAQKKGFNDGCTALTVLLYGPDDDGSLKVVTAHVGDCRAVMCREGAAVRLTEDHKPSRKDEKRRIEAAGGKVVYVRGVWRVMSMVGKKIFGLSTARSIGDYHMKYPKLLVPALPDLRVFTVDFYRDMFIILGSDGIWDVVSDQEACDIVSKCLSNESPKAAAEILTSTAAERGSTDDKTVTIVYFSWRRDLFA